MVSHNGTTHTFGNGDGNQTELLKLHFKVDDVADNFNPRSFRVATEYENNTGYYTYITNGNYASAYKVYIDGNYGTESTNLDGARGDITLHPKLLDVEDTSDIGGHSRVLVNLEYKIQKIHIRIGRLSLIR